MPIDKRILDQLIVDAGSADEALRALKKAAVEKQTLLSQRAMAGAFDVNVKDWEVVNAFLQDRPHPHEVQGFQAICESVRDAVVAEDGNALFRNLLLVFRITTPC